MSSKGLKLYKSKVGEEPTPVDTPVEQPETPVKEKKVREKKPRTAAQIAATERMREARKKKMETQKSLTKDIADKQSEIASKESEIQEAEQNLKRKREEETTEKVKEEAKPELTEPTIQAKEIPVVVEQPPPKPKKVKAEPDYSEKTFKALEGYIRAESKRRQEKSLTKKAKQEASHLIDQKIQEPKFQKQFDDHHDRLYKSIFGRYLFKPFKNCFSY